jgi:hypothetical protein
MTWGNHYIRQVPIHVRSALLELEPRSRLAITSPGYTRVKDLAWLLKRMYLQAITSTYFCKALAFLVNIIFCCQPSLFCHLIFLPSPILPRVVRNLFPFKIPRVLEIQRMYKSCRYVPDRHQSTCPSNATRNRLGRLRYVLVVDLKWRGKAVFIYAVFVGQV